MGFASDEQRLFFEANGYLLLEGALSADEVASLRRACDAAEAAWRADDSRPGCRIPEFLEIEAILEYGPAFRDLLIHPRIFPLVREAVGTDIGLLDHAYYVTPPGGRLGRGAWHRDVRTPGVYHPRSTVMVRAMITLEDIAEDGGATLVLPGSHRFTDDVTVPEAERPEEMPGAVTLSCRAGAAYFFNGNLWHAPSHNRSEVTRRVVLFNYGHKWMRMWKGHEPSPELAASADTPMLRQLLGLTGAYYGEDAELETVEFS
ncbi:MAG: phytanoyl-CoA dioxygenase family protein [Acidobacteriota bacterium]